MTNTNKSNQPIQHTTISDIITIREISSWQQGNIITISAGTGGGKSHFIKNGLYDYAKLHNKRILMLVHRRNCIDQFLYEIERDNKTDVIAIKTYQSIESAIRYGKPFNLSAYDYLVIDEFHYFLSDSSINKYTDMSLESILNQSNSVRIFMSATGEKMKHYLTNPKHRNLSTIDYNLPHSYLHIKRLEFYKSDDTLNAYIDHAIKNNIKAILFIDDVERAFILHQQYKEHTLFNCSENQSAYYKYVDKDKIQSMLRNERFNELILITTSVMDSGVNIIDSELNHIVCDIKSLDVLRQCVGRKRIKTKGDYLILHIKHINNQMLGGMETQLKSKLKHSLYLRNNGESAYIEKFGRENDDSNIVYDVLENGKTSKKINEMIFLKYLSDINDVYMFKKNGYHRIISKIFNLPYNFYEEEKEVKDLSMYLDSIVGMKLYKEDQDKLKQIFKDNGLNSRTLGINTLNGNLKDRKLPYVINIGDRKSYRDEEGKVKKERSHWIVGKIVY